MAHQRVAVAISKITGKKTVSPGLIATAVTWNIETIRLIKF